MSLKAQAAGVAIGGAVILLGLWYVKRQASGALSAAGAAISGTASDAWNAAQTPVLDFGGGPVATVANDVGNGIVAAPSNALDTLSFGTIGGTTGSSASLLDTLKAGPMGGLFGMLTGDGNSNIFGPAPGAGLDFGTGANNWSN